MIGYSLGDSLSCRLRPSRVLAAPAACGELRASEFQRWLARRGPREDALQDSGDAIAGLRSPKMARIEAALFVADGALSTRKLVQLATLADTAEAKLLIEQLNYAYDESGSAFRIERVATGYQMLTRPVFASWLNRIHQRQTALKLSQPAMETLTIVAYRQPITRADVESIRGVQSAEMLKQLMERGLVRIAGEDDSLGRPYLYDTTRTFLELFGLRTLDDLPMADRLRHPVQKNDAPEVPAAEEDASDSDDEFDVAEADDLELEEDELEDELDDEFDDIDDDDAAAA